MVDATQAKEIALDWLKLQGDKPTPAIISRLIKQIKGTMEAGFSAEDIQYTIAWVMKNKANVYAYGYIDACINDVIKQRNAEHAKRNAKQHLEQLTVETITGESEVLSGDETSERNRRKAERLGTKSRERKKHYFDLFEG